MKNLHIIIILIAIVLASCYKDLGNYNYKSLGEIVIDGIDENNYYYLYLGEPFTMPEPQISFTDSTQAHDNLSYQWLVDKKLVSTEKILNAEIALEPQSTYYTGEFIVTDEQTGISYIQKFRVMVTSNFAQGWMWLTEKDGRAELNMMTTNQKFYENAFTTINNEELGKNAYTLTEHFSQVGYNWYSGILVVTGTKSVELDWSSLRKEAWMYQEFTGGSLPSGLNPVAAAFTKNYSCVIGDHGEVHIRHSQGGYLYEGRYPSMPFYTPFKLSPLVASAFPPAYNVILFFDEMTDSYVYLDNNGELKSFAEVTDEGDAFAVTQMNKKLIFISAVSQTGNNSIFYAIVQDRNSKEYFVQQFEFGLTGQTTYLKTISEQKFPDIIDENTHFAIGYKTSDVWYSKGSALYRYNRELNDKPMMFKDFRTGNILALAFNNYGDQYGIIVANGKNYDFYWEGTDGSSYKKQSDLSGKIKNLIYKIGYATFYQ